MDLKNDKNINNINKNPFSNNSNSLEEELKIFKLQDSEYYSMLNYWKVFENDIEKNDLKSQSFAYNKQGSFFYQNFILPKEVTEYSSYNNNCESKENFIEDKNFADIKTITEEASELLSSSKLDIKEMQNSIMESSEEEVFDASKAKRIKNLVKNLNKFCNNKK